MDEEDLADAEEARGIQTSDAFAGLGRRSGTGESALGGLADLFRPGGETMGIKLLKRMGWREGQGVGPKVRRHARLGDDGREASSATTHLFAPEDMPTAKIVRKTDKKGLGFEGDLSLEGLLGKDGGGDSDRDDDDAMGPLIRPRPLPSASKSKPKSGRGGIGMGVLNDTGSDDEDPYEIGPRISYSRIVGGGDKKKKKKGLSANTAIANPALKQTPVFISRKTALAKASQKLTGHDGRPPLEGFVFGKHPDELIVAINSSTKYPRPTIPPGWRPSPRPLAVDATDTATTAAFVSTAEAARASKLDPRSRAEVLGEKQLPGKSVFDFMTPEARDRLAAASGRTDLPRGLGQMPAGASVPSEEERRRELLRQVPELDKATALAALARGAGGGAPYADDDEKRARYRAYLEHWAAGGGSSTTAPPLPRAAKGMSDDDWLRELAEFQSCARIFKPMTGFMASRFTTSTTTTTSSSSPASAGRESLVSRPPPKPKDPAEEAAAMGMFGPLTRSVVDFYPTRLLCKRFGVPPPPHVKSDGAGDDVPGKSSARDKQWQMPTQQQYEPYYGSPAQQQQQQQQPSDVDLQRSQLGHAAVSGFGQVQAPEPVVVDPDRNAALEGNRAAEEVFKSIFGDSDDDE